MAEFIEFLSESALKDLQKANAELVTMVANVDKVSQKMKGISTPSGSDSAVKSLNEQYKAQEKAIVSLQQKLTTLTTSKKKEVQAILDQSKSYQGLEKQRQREIASLEKEQQKLAAAQNLYNKTQQQLNLVQAAYNNLAIKKERYNNLTAQEEQRLLTLQRVSERYNTTLKAVDATVGKHTRNVGNYTGSFNPLSNSINQLTREMPAFSNSVQTGFMAISNNLPIFFDAISNTNREIKAMRAEGQQVPGLFKQLTSSLLSFGTALSVGVTLLTVYGKEIVSWVGGLIDADSALKELTERQVEFGKARLQGRKDAVSEIVELRKYLAVVKDRNVSDEERNIALKQLRSQYPFYFKNLKDEQILNGQSAEAVDKLNTALEKRKEVEKKSELTTLNKQKLIDLEVEKELQEDLVKVAEQRLRSLANRDFIRPEALAAAANDEAKAKEKLININRQIDVITKQTLKNDTDIFNLKKETIGLEYTEEQQRKTKLKQLRDLNLADVPASEFALMQAILNAEIENNKKIFDNDRKTNEERADSFELYTIRRKQLADLEMEEEIRLENIANEKLLSQKGLSEKQRADIVEQNRINIQKIEFEHANKIIGINEDVIGKIKALYDKVSNQRRVNIINQQELDDIRQLNVLLSNLDVTSSLERYKNAEKIKVELTKTRQERILENELRNINAEIENFDVSKDNIEKLNTLTDQRIAKEKELANAINQRLADEAEKTKQLIINTKQYFRQIEAGFLDKSGLGSLNFFMQLDENGQSTFDKLIAGAQTMGQKVAIAFNGMAEVAQEVYSFMNQQQEMQYQANINRLQRQKDIAIQFAGESTTARAEIERQYEERRLKIERRKAQQAKDTAIFNLIIDTAQAVVGALAEQNYAGAILFGALGAAQIAMVSSQPLPQFEKGTDNAPEGWAWTQEKGAEVITDKNGKIKTTGSNKGAQMTYLNKGDKVYTASESAMMFNSDLNSIFAGNGILPSVVVNNDNSDVKNEIKALGKIIQSKESITLVRDEKGERIYKKVQGQRQQMMNARLNIKGYEL